MLMFTTISDYGNNLYVYNVNIGSVNVGIEEANASSSFHIFQNPVNDFFNIQLALTIYAKMEVTHILGQQIFFEQIPSTQNCVQLNTSGWNNGIYFITI